MSNLTWSFIAIILAIYGLYHELKKDMVSIALKLYRKLDDIDFKLEKLKTELDLNNKK